jgi:divalent metal cation (Fe/Co/Zn/Cd) transporter
MVVCIGIVTTYNKRKGLLLFGNMTSNMDFILLGIVLGSLIVCKLSKFVSIFKYGDIVGTVIISLIVMYYGIRVIVNSIKYMEGKDTKTIDENEISKQKEVKKIDSIKYLGFGGIRRTEVNIELNNGINMTDLSGFALSLQDYVLKSGEIAQVNLIDSSKVVNKVNKPHVRSKKEDARNSGSRNSKTNSKKKNTKKTNKKR